MADNWECDDVPVLIINEKQLKLIEEKKMIEEAETNQLFNNNNEHISLKTELIKPDKSIKKRNRRAK
jgi:hypothetical protein